MDFLGDVWSWFTDSKQWSGNSSIPNRLYEHVKMSLVAVALAIVAGLPIALWLGHKRRFGWLAINVSNVGRAVPSFAILVFGAQIWGISTWWGIPIAALVALIALALPPIVTNAYVGMSEVDDSVRDAAKGMGMKGRQSLLRAELPTAVPPVMNGIRIALLQVIATAGLAALVGAGGLGRYIIDGIAVQDTVRVFGGAILVAGLALGADGLLALAERAATPRGLRLAEIPRR
jgi:osmoprotectant transport system permease protein